MKKIPTLGKVGVGISLAFLASLLFVNCDDAAKTNASTDTTLYARLGGTAAITAVIDSFIPQVLADTVIQARFDTIPAPHVVLLKQNLVDLIAVSTGCTTCTYTGRSMMDAHHGMNIQGAEFDALVADLGTALTKNKVPTAEQNELVNLLAPLRGQIVGQ
jgi:hemoglobin